MASRGGGSSPSMVAQGRPPPLVGLLCAALLRGRLVDNPCPTGRPRPPVTHRASPWSPSPAATATGGRRRYSALTSRMFSGFRSVCTSRSSCMNATASSSWRATDCGMKGVRSECDGTPDFQGQWDAAGAVPGPGVLPKTRDLRAAAPPCPWATHTLMRPWPPPARLQAGRAGSRCGEGSRTGWGPASQTPCTRGHGSQTIPSGAHTSCGAVQQGSSRARGRRSVHRLSALRAAERASHLWVRRTCGH